MWSSLLAATLALALAASAHAQTCTTPDSMSGTCIVIRSCPPLYKLLQGPKPLPRDVVQFLQKSTCGFQGHNPKVCCPGLDPIQTQQRPTPATPAPTQSPWGRPPVTRPPPSRPPPQPVDDRNDRPVNVEKEPNLRLLPHSVCGPSSTDRIINGNKTNVYEYPWMARLGYQNRNGNIAYRCGGSLINSRYVLTAAHCVEGGRSTESLTTVRLGENDIRTEIDCSIISGTEVCAPPAIDVGVDEVISHPDFSLQGVNRLQNDVALVRLERRVMFTEAVKPICLPVGNEQFKDLDRKKVTVAGWGTTENGKCCIGQPEDEHEPETEPVDAPVAESLAPVGHGSSSLLQVNVPVVPGQQCVDVYKSEVRISPSKQLCAGGTREGDSCQGDSGGPLKYAGIGHQTGDLRTVQFGIVSFGPKRCGSEGMPGVYTRVGYYMQWILRNMRP
ncbi:phenoloxidase-activating enzyme 1-like isoform X2 [Frankliniella occidentalis]|uniref:CLIP domain-containing serine protease n=1 Tax=Frankliniella occidentalis TaxID=133901 RepID=A0A9C6X476_FRAOC|nr:phenoloxidase-activating enzyme 1-like isoform X2 [Frankliniella occidentalis]